MKKLTANDEAIRTAVNALVGEVEGQLVTEAELVGDFAFVA